MYSLGCFPTQADLHDFIAEVRTVFILLIFWMNKTTSQTNHLRLSSHVQLFKTLYIIKQSLFKNQHLCPVQPGGRGPHRIHPFGQVPPSHDQSAAGAQVRQLIISRVVLYVRLNE